jgi:4a-hydroxytetrahydrobiopterin dehydratase
VSRSELASVLLYASSGCLANTKKAPLWLSCAQETLRAPLASLRSQRVPQKQSLRLQQSCMALIRRASTTLRSLATYAKVADRETTVAALRLRGWKDQHPKRDAVAKRFEFASFNEAFGWMSRVALQAEAADHHPEWTNLYSIVEVTLTTHAVDGLSDRDIQMADFMDHAAARFAPKPFK